MATLDNLCSTRLLSAILLAAVIVLPALGQPTRNNIYLNTGGSFGAEPFVLREQHSPGINLGIGIGLPLTAKIDLVLSANYNQFRQRDIGLISDKRIERGNDHITSATAGIKYKILSLSRFTPYLVGSSGVYRWQSDRLTYMSAGGYWGSDDFSRTAFGIDLGAGIMMQTSSVLHLFLEPRYTFVFFSRPNDDRPVQYVPVRFGIVWMR